MSPISHPSAVVSPSDPVFDPRARTRHFSIHCTCLSSESITRSFLHFLLSPLRHNTQVSLSVVARRSSLTPLADMSLALQPERSDLSREDNVKTGSGSDLAAENPVSKRSSTSLLLSDVADPQ